MKCAANIRNYIKELNSKGRDGDKIQKGKSLLIKANLMQLKEKLNESIDKMVFIDYPGDGEWLNPND